MTDETAASQMEKLSFPAILKKYTSLSGRASRKELLIFLIGTVAVNAIVLLLTFLTACVLSLKIYPNRSLCDMDLSWICSFQTILFAVLVLATIPVAVQRLHDLGKGGKFYAPFPVWVMLNMLLPVLPIGTDWVILPLALLEALLFCYSAVLWIVLFFKGSQKEENAFGSCPKPMQIRWLPEKEDAEDMAEEEEVEPFSLSGYVSGILEKYRQFDGRASRREFWQFVLFTAIVSVGLTLLNFLIILVLFWFDPALGDYFSFENYPANIIYLPVLLPFILISCIWRFGILCPAVAVAIRRMHDTGRSGKFVLLLAPYLFLSTIGDWLPHSLFPPVVNIVFSVIALLGGAVFIFFACQKSRTGENQYDLPGDDDGEEVEESEEEPEEE
ncbi:MAG: DUF805 domain-containing protein [Lentisphaerae bacterium]|nr:DUF805 domain-containing protein [Lentisphaerota bacterium]